MTSVNHAGFLFFTFLVATAGIITSGVVYGSVKSNMNNQVRNTANYHTMTVNGAISSRSLSSFRLRSLASGGFFINNTGSLNISTIFANQIIINNSSKGPTGDQGKNDAKTT